MKMEVNKNAIAYCATTLGTTMMNSIFQYYYVKVFLNVYRISNYWFNVAQVVFLIWNAINDPLFGYFQDSSTWAVLRKRRLAILYGAPLFAISFLVPWFPWTWLGFTGDWIVGIHLMTALCFYDGLFTFVLLAHCALFAEMSLLQEERQTTLKYGQVASIIGSSALLVSVTVYKSEQSNFQSFQAVCVVVAFLSWLLMRYSGMNVKVAVEACSTNTSTGDQDGRTAQDTEPLLTLLKQILTQRSFVCFVMMNFFQVFHVTFCSNFFLIFAEHLIGPHVIPSMLFSVLTGSVFLLPRILVLITSPLLARFGSYKLILWSFYTKVSFAAIVFVAGRHNIWLLFLFFLVDNCLPDATFSLFNLSVSDIIDHDMEKYHRNTPVSSMIFGTNALFTKPAQSLAPMMVVHILSQYGYKTLKAERPLLQDPSFKLGTSDLLSDAMFYLLCLIPLCVGVIQIIVWKSYPLKKPKKAGDLSKIAV